MGCFDQTAHIGRSHHAFSGQAQQFLPVEMILCVLKPREKKFRVLALCILRSNKWPPQNLIKSRSWCSREKIAKNKRITRELNFFSYISEVMRVQNQYFKVCEVV